MRRSGTNILQAASYAGRNEWKQHCADLSYLLAEFLEIRAYWDEAIAAHSLAQRAGRYLADPARVARAARALSVVCQQTGRHDTATPLAEEDRSDLPVARRSPRRGRVSRPDRPGPPAHRPVPEAFACFRDGPCTMRPAIRGVAGTLSHAGIACWHVGRYPEAHDHLRQALSLNRDVGDRRGEAKALNNLGRVFLYNGEYRQALDAYQSSLQISGDWRTAERGDPLSGDRQRPPLPGQLRGGAVRPSRPYPARARARLGRTSGVWPV